MSRMLAIALALPITVMALACSTTPEPEPAWEPDAEPVVTSPVAEPEVAPPTALPAAEPIRVAEPMLPKTASATPLVGLVGLAALGLGGALRFARYRTSAKRR